MKRFISLVVVIIILANISFASPLGFDDIKPSQSSITISLPSGISVNSADTGIFCEGGCDDVVLNSSNKKWLFGLIGVGALIYILRCKECCINPPIGNPPPTILIPPVVIPPTPDNPTNPVPEPSYTLFVFFILLLGIYFNYERTNNTIRSC